MYSANNAPNCIPFLDLVTPHVELERELTVVFRRALLTAGFIGGPVVEEFETAFAAFCGTSRSIAVSSGTDALRFAIIASGVRPGDVVLTVPHTFIATTEAISQAGAVPEFIDIDDQTYNMSVEMLEQFLQKKCSRNKSGKLISRRSGRPVTAVVPVHLYGQMADMDSILKLADEHGLTVIEDACQAHGAKYFSKKLDCWMQAGSMGRAAAFSFYPGKNLGACGEAGAVTTNDHDLAGEIRMLRDHGQAEKYYHDVEGYNGRLDAIQAGLLYAKLTHLAKWNLQRRDRAAEYNRILATNEAVSLPYEPSRSRGVYHLYVIRTNDRDAMMSHLRESGIGTGIHYPLPLHLQKAYAPLSYCRGDFPVAERISAEIISLPMFPHLTTAQQAAVAEEILAFASNTPRKPTESEESLVASTERVA
jgi:dTDP-4-amino-4,6-dideoxygalactose transaminase